MKKNKKFKPNKNKHEKFSLNDKKTGRAKGYDTAWEEYRKEFLKHNPKCYVCGAKARHVDHIYAVKSFNKDQFWNPYNLQPLCHPCHSQVTGLFDKYEKPRVEEKIKWMVKMRKLNDVNIKIKVVPIRIKR